jgi:hypothetical protein
MVCLTHLLQAAKVFEESMNDLLNGLLDPSAAGIAAGGWMLCLPICPAIFGQMVEEIAAARKS